MDLIVRNKLYQYTIHPQHNFVGGGGASILMCINVYVYLGGGGASILMCINVYVYFGFFM